MRMSEMHLLKAMLAQIAQMQEGSYYLTQEERLALHHFNQAADMGQDYLSWLHKPSEFGWLM